MAAYWDQELPHLDATEKGYDFMDNYGDALSPCSVTTADWKHIVACRFGPPRPAGSNYNWTGECYRYDIFAKDGYWALRWVNGFDEGWLISKDKSRRDETNLLATIVGIAEEERRWDACHFVWKMFERSASVAKRAEAKRYNKAFVEGRLKKRKIRGRDEYKVEIVNR